MLSKDSFSRAFKGTLLYEMRDLKLSFIIICCIIFGNLILQLLINLIMLNTNNSSSNNGGIISIGFFVGMVFMFVSGIVVSGVKEMKAGFAFPVNRKIFNLVKLIVFGVMALIILVVTSIAYLFEYSINSALMSIFGNFVYTTSVTPEAFVAGFWISFCYFMVIATITHLFFTLFNRFKLPAVGAFLLILGIMFSVSPGRYLLNEIMRFFIAEQSIPMLSIKLIVSVLATHYLGYLVQRKMEVAA